MQAGDTLAPALHLPEWVNSLLAFFLILGFPLAMFFAWAYEMTPEGLKKEKDVDRSQSITHVTGQKLNNAIIGILVVALVYFAIDKFMLAPKREAEMLKTAQSAPAPVAESGTPSPAEKSIAVLPFVNMSNDAGNEYFSDGLTEELLNLLAKIPQLRVTARTSSFAFKGQQIEIPEIARRLGVDHVLEGSVRKSGDQVRITAQLIRADNGFHLWSETYDRTLDNIFTIQDEISAAVVDALKVTLLGDAPRSRETDPEAYRLYLEGQYFFRQRSVESIKKSTRLLKQALAIDPDYAPALAELAFAQLWLGAAGGEEPKVAAALSKQAADRVLTLDPGLSLAHLVQAVRYVYYDFEFEKGLDEYRVAMELDPGSAMGLGGYGVALARLGRFDQSLKYLQMGADRDPLEPEAFSNIGRTYEATGDYDRAEASFRKALELSPDYIGISHRLARLNLLRGEYAQALEDAMREKDPVYGATARAKAYFSIGDKPASDRELATLIDESARLGTFQIAEIYAWRGEADAAFEWLDQCLEIRDSGMASILGDPFLASLWDDPRWEILLNKLKLWDAWQAMPPEWGGPQP
jgi:adenylate cyclase